MSFSRRRESQILHVSSLEAVTKKAPFGATAMRLTALLCSARCATSTPRGCHGVLLARLAAQAHARCQSHFSMTYCRTSNSVEVHKM